MRIITFTLTTFILQGAIFYGFLGGVRPNPLDPIDALKVFAIMYTPFIGALITQLIYREKITFDRIFGKLNRYHLMALLVPIPLMILTSILSILSPEVVFNSSLTGGIEMMEGLNYMQQSYMTDQIAESPIRFLFLTIFQSLGMAMSFSLFTAFGEEYGWRGYLIKQFKSFWAGSLFIGVVWGLWHAPLILAGHNYPTNPQLGVLMMVIVCLALTPLMNYMTLKGKSVLIPALFHGSFNAFVGLSFIPVSGGDTFTKGFGSWAFAVTALVLFFIIAYKDLKNLNNLN